MFLWIEEVLCLKANSPQMVVVCSLQHCCVHVFARAQIRRIMTDSDDVLPPGSFSNLEQKSFQIGHLWENMGKNHKKPMVFMGSPMANLRRSGPWIAGPLKMVPGWRWRRKVRHETKAKGKETDQWFSEFFERWMSDFLGNLPFGICLPDHSESYVFVFVWDLGQIKEIVEKVIETEIDHDDLCCSQLLTFEETTESKTRSEGFHVWSTARFAKDQLSIKD